MRSDAAAGFGGLLTTQVEHVELGSVGTRVLRARVRRRQLQLAVGSGPGFRVTVGRLRPVAVEVSEPDRTYEVAIPAVPDPRLTAARRTALLWTASLAITALAWWVRRRRGHRPRVTLDPAINRSADPVR